MSYWKLNSKNSRELDSFGLATSHTSNQNGTLSEFHELELGVVLDIVLDDSHPIFSNGDSLHQYIDADRWPADLTDKKPNPITDIDYTWIGRALIRPTTSGKLIEKDQLLWAFPLENNISEYPLLNELVVLTIFNGKLYYSKKVNIHNLPNNNLDFAVNRSLSGQENTVLYSKTLLTGSVKSILDSPPPSKLGYEGYAGKYFCANNKIRTIKRFEGDLLVESRHGQTIHMTAYDSVRENDVGDIKNKDYKNGGNPMISIRNRQRPLLKEGQKLSLHNSPNPATIFGTKYEKNVGGYLEENINHDGSTIQITSGKTISGWVTTCYKKMFGLGEEVSLFNGPTTFTYPILNGDQIVLNSDRLILSSRYGEMLHYSKKRYGVVTDNEYTVDAHQQIVLTTNTKTVINSPAIYLGQYDMTNEPALLGQTTINWMYELCNWLLEHNHWYHHSHTNAGQESPSQTQLPVQVQKLISLRDKLSTLMSKRVFITGGGLAPGQDGGNIVDGTVPVKINVSNGNGTPGGWKGSNYRLQ